MKKTRIIIMSVVIIFVVVFMSAVNRKSTLVYEGSLAETKQMLFAYLDVKENSKYSPASGTNSPLYELVGYILHVSDEKSILGKRSIVAQHEYNIGASGGVMVRFDLVPVDNNNTRVAVSYKDAWVGIWPPFVFWNPGIIVKHRIKDSLNNFIREQNQTD